MNERVNEVQLYQCSFIYSSSQEKHTLSVKGADQSEHMHSLVSLLVIHSEKCKRKHLLHTVFNILASLCSQPGLLEPK